MIAGKKLSTSWCVWMPTMMGRWTSLNLLTASTTQPRILASPWQSCWPICLNTCLTSPSNCFEYLDFVVYVTFFFTRAVHTELNVGLSKSLVFKSGFKKLWINSVYFPSRLERLLNKAKSVLDYFEPYLGRIEIQGSANRIERVYFEIKQSHIDQWEKPQIKVDDKAYLEFICSMWTYFHIHAISTVFYSYLLLLCICIIGI